jgi:hypothetical protein
MSNPIDQWLRLSKTLRSYQITCVCLAGCFLVAALCIVRLSHQGPAVVLVCKDKRVHLAGEYKKYKVQPEDIKETLRQFVLARFSFTRLDPELLRRQIQPLATSSFAQKSLENFTRAAKGDLKQKKVSQSVTNLDVIVEDARLFASFDKILKVEGVAIPIPTEIVFKVTAGPRTKFNPSGIYVHGMIEHEKK